MQCLHLGVRNEIGLTGDLGEQVADGIQALCVDSVREQLPRLGHEVCNHALRIVWDRSSTDGTQSSRLRVRDA